MSLFSVQVNRPVSSVEHGEEKWEEKPGDNVHSVRGDVQSGQEAHKAAPVVMRVQQEDRLDVVHAFH